MKIIMIKKAFLKNYVRILFLILLLILLPFLTSKYIAELLTQMLIWAIMAMSLDILLGYTGLPSLGHATYMGIGAYATAIVVTQLNGNFIIALALGITIPTAVAAIFGLLALRAISHYFLLITMALQMVIWGLAYRWVSFTKGDTGLAGISRPILSSNFSLGETIYFYYYVLAFFIIALILMQLIISSPFGKTLLGIRESESRMRVMGYNVWLHKYLAFIIAGAFSGFSGFLWVLYTSYVNPTNVAIVYSLEAMLMVALGGAGTLFGALIGSGIVVFLKNFVSNFSDRWMMIMGIVFVMTVYFAPNGILGIFKSAVLKTQLRIKT